MSIKPTSLHPFQLRPHHTLVALTIPVILSMTAEPILALVDTAFISSLGVDSLAALGVGTTALSAIFWIFNFLGIGTQTEIAQVMGKGRSQDSKKIISMALVLAFIIGILLIALLLPNARWMGEALGASGAVLGYAVSYMKIRLFGAPAVLMMLVIFGAMRGRQDMRTPLWIALGVNALNLILDWAMIFGRGPFPALGVAGSAYASTISQWLGTFAGILILSKTIGYTKSFSTREAVKLLKVGGDLFARTALLNVFLIYTTRSANNLGPNAGAAHQVVRQVFMFTGLALDGFASTVQSLVGYFIGQEAKDWAKRVVKVGTQWAVGLGTVLGLSMWFGRDLVINLLVPASAVAVFIPTWVVTSISQPVNAVAFLTDGAHWGTGDFRYLRNAMFIATGIGLIGIWLVDRSGIASLSLIWAVIGLWVIARAVFGSLRIWPGIGNSIFKNT